MTDKIKSKQQIENRIQYYQKLLASINGRNIDSHKTRVLFGAIITELKLILDANDYVYLDSEASN